MSDADAERKAKAERAKKLLAQRQKKKKAEAAGTSPAPTPSSPASTLADAPNLPSARTSLSLDDSVRAEVAAETKEEPVVPDVVPLQAEPKVEGPKDQEVSKIPEDEVEPQQDEKSKKKKKKGKKAKEQEDDGEEKIEEGDAFTKVKDDADNIDPKPVKVSQEKQQSSPEVAVPPSPKPVGTSPPLPAEAPSDNTSKLQETVSLLIFERSDLQNQIADLQSQLSTAKGDSQLLVEGRTLISRLEQDKVELETKLGESEKEAGKSAELEREAERIRKDLDNVESERDVLQSDKERLERELRDVSEKEKERIAELEKALERERTRESGLETEIGRLRQSNTELSTSLEKITTDLESSKESSSLSSKELSDLQSAHSALQKSHEHLTTEHTTLRSTHDELASTHNELKSTYESSSSTVKSLETSVTSLKTELESAKGKLGSITKRADTAEKRRTALQSENDELVKQLEEVRGKVVEAMEEKATMASAVESWETKSKQWEKARLELESEVEVGKTLRSQITSLAEENRSKDETITQLRTIEKKLPQLEKENEDVKNILGERDQTIAKNQLSITEKEAIISQRESTISTQESELSSLRSELETLRSQSSTQPSVHSTQPERTQDDTSADRALEISSLTSQIRELESSLHTSNTRIHSLSKQLTDLTLSHNQIQKERDELVGSFSPSGSRGPSTKSYFLSPKDEYPSSPGVRRIPSGNGGNSAVDAILPPSVRHKRQVSLNALKARMEFTKPLSSPNKLSSLHEDEERPGTLSTDSNGWTKTRKQFGDEIMFCCPACEGDLITL
ncbi:uncharacterized protein IL334_005818 [Kwoniella shivajii]|uniref:Myosin heavy chain n=1 Tax=Kwoniella shivajii TaxID=564305 RepID=A0ABZ1D5G9_9TREE|nr:hypothetical protein IL334_005818 [Kwoniella shivajii]